MAIQINKVQGSVPVSDKKITYRDLELDLKETAIPTVDKQYGRVSRTDLKQSLDEAAILNSIKNIFTTSPGQKILNPAFGVDLTRWLFEPLNDFTANEIGQTVLQGIERFEPRVKVANVTVLTDMLNERYIIKLSLRIPQLNINRKYTATLMQPGFDFLTENE